jgi:carboxylesterase type B
MPAWPPYTTEQRATMILDTACRVVHDPDREMRLLWTRVLSNA